MNNWSQANNPEKVEALLKQMQEMYERGHHHLRPNHQCFVVVLGAWAKHGTDDSIARAQTILSRMEDLFLETNEPQYRMNAYGYNLVMKAISSSDRENRVDQLERIIKHMTALAEKHDIKELLPDKVSYSILMKALIRESKPGFAHRVNDILETMQQRSLQESKASIAPDVVCYAIAMDAWEKSKDPDAAKRAREVMNGMAKFAAKSGIKRLMPNAFCFNTLINIHAQNGKGEEAEKVLADMEKEYRRGKDRVRPDAATFTSCIDAWAASGDKDCIKRSQSLFERMMERYKAGQLDCKPTNRTFTAMMISLAKSRVQDKAHKAQDLLEIYENIGGKHNLRTYNALIYAFSSETGNEQAKYDALGRSMAIFHRMRDEDNLEPDSITYSSLLHACSLLIADPHERQTAIQDVFQKCCEDGKVNELVLKRLSRVSSRDFLNTLVSEDSTKQIRLESLPVEWTLHANAA
jgi:pentatricopeptide repeat protein